MKVSNLITAPYYHVPVWMSILIDGLIKRDYVRMLKHTHRDVAGMCHFRASYGEEEAREEILFVWNATPEQVYTHLSHDLGTDVRMLVNMAEEYSQGRGGQEETKVYRGIMQLIIARAVELFSVEKPGETLTINGDFSLIGRLSPAGRLRINGKVSRVEAPIGLLLEVASERCPELSKGLTAELQDKIWHIQKAEPWHEAPITGFYFR